MSTYVAIKIFLLTFLESALFDFCNDESLSSPAASLSRRARFSYSTVETWTANLTLGGKYLHGVIAVATIVENSSVVEIVLLYAKYID